MMMMNEQQNKWRKIGLINLMGQADSNAVIIHKWQEIKFI